MIVHHLPLLWRRPKHEETCDRISPFSLEQTVMIDSLVRLPESTQ